MKTRQLGQNGPRISALGYGAMSFSDFYGPATDEGSMAILDACVELGITHVDTSNIYGMGRSETVIGKWLKARGGKPPFTIATKAGITREDGKRVYRNTPDHLRQELEGSLQRMGVDYIDLYYIHRRQSEIPIEEVAGTMGDLVKEGKIGAIGFSEIAPSSLRRAHGEYPVAAVQSEYSLSTRAPDLGLVQACANLGTTLVAFSPVGRGLLTDRPHDAAKIAEMPFMKGNPRFQEPNHSANLAYNARFRALAADMGVAAASLAIAWVLSRGDHVLPIPGTRGVDHLRELTAGADLDLSAEDLSRIDDVLPVGWAHGDRYNDGQWIGPERYC